jgi:arginine-tRNA-protein transferase
VKCRSLRVDVEAFEPSKSQRRSLKRNAAVETTLHRATVSTEHVRLYNLWHQDMTARRGWPLQQTTPQDYVNAFLIGDWPFAHEIRYFRDGRLIGVGLVDLLEDSLSSVYFYHAPDWRPRGPGTFSILTEIDYGRQSGRKHLYLGYAIHECPSMAYKFRFGPHEILETYVSDDAAPVWSNPV